MFGGVLGLQNPQFQAGEKSGKKSQKKVGKRTDPQPLIDMMNDVTGSYNKPISIRQILKQNKIDMSWMNWITWSPDACKELKRLCTRVAKKQVSKAKTVNPGIFNPIIPSTQFPQFPVFSP